MSERMRLADEQLHTLRHMLGINTDKRDPKPYRDYYCANPADPKMVELERLGAVEKYSEHGGYWWYRTTTEGCLAAISSQRAALPPKKKRLYSKFLDVREAIPDVTFGEFLTSDQFRESRNAA